METPVSPSVAMITAQLGVVVGECVEGAVPFAWLPGRRLRIRLSHKPLWARLPDLHGHQRDFLKIHSRSVRKKQGLRPYRVSGTTPGMPKHGPEQRVPPPAKTAPFSLRPALSASACESLSPPRCQLWGRIGVLGSPPLASSGPVWLQC